LLSTGWFQERIGA